MTMLFLAVDLALFFNQYVNPIALKAISWKYYIVYCIWLAFELAVVWKFYIETRNTPLEEIVKHFDGDGAVLGGMAATEKSRALAAEIDIDVPTVAQPDVERGTATGIEQEKHAHTSAVEHKEHRDL